MCSSDLSPLCVCKKMIFGSMPNDGGNLLLSDDQRAELIRKYPEVSSFIKPFQGSEEFINNIPRWCLWFVGISPNEIKNIPDVIDRVNKVYNIRKSSSRLATQRLAEKPTLFGEIRQPTDVYLAVPKTSSENRDYVPMGMLPPTTVASTELFSIAGPDIYDLGILCSRVHNTWLKTVCGRLKSDFRYSIGIVYNNFPWPDVNSTQKAKVEKAAQAVLDARELYSDSSLADLYGPLLMPVELRKAHNALDKVVDRCYRKEPFKDDAQRLKLLFERYAELIAEA